MCTHTLRGTANGVLTPFCDFAPPSRYYLPFKGKTFQKEVRKKIYEQVRQKCRPTPSAGISLPKQKKQPFPKQLRRTLFLYVLSLSLSYYLYLNTAIKNKYKQMEKYIYI